GYEPKLWNPCGIEFLFIAEGNWFESEDRFACLIHGLYFFFETYRRRGVNRAQLSRGRDKDWIAASRVLPANASNIGGCVGGLQKPSTGRVSEGTPDTYGV